MKCPVCNVTLNISERNNVEIDYCPECRGVWLDRGELDKILDKASQYEQPREYKNEYKETPREYKEQKYDHKSGYDKYGRKKKKEGFMGEIFDIFGD